MNKQTITAEQYNDMLKIYMDRMYDSMNNLIYCVQHECVFDYWNEHKPKNREYTEEFFQDVWKLFAHCICMSIDKDPLEYINSLEAMKRNKEVKDD